MPPPDPPGSTHLANATAGLSRSPVAAHPDACLFTGAPAVAFVLRAADQPAYVAALSTLDGHITALTRHRLDRADERIERGQLAQLGDASLCHGWAGLVQTTRRAAADAGPDSALAALLPRLHTRFAQRLHGHRPTTCDGLLEGAAGVELTRHTTADVLPASRWDACLLIAPPILEKPQTEGV